MEEYTRFAIVNRDEPIPVIQFDESDGISENDDTEVKAKNSKRQRVRRYLSSSNIKDKASAAKGKVTESKSSLQDRLLEKCVFRPRSDNIC